MATFRKRNGSWEYRIRYKDVYTGKKREKSKGGFKRRQDAVHAADRLEGSMQEGYTPRNENPTFEKCIAEWFEMAKVGYRYGSQFFRLTSIKRINKEIGQVRIRELSGKIISQYLLEMDNKGYATSSIESDYAVIKMVVEHTLRSEYILRNPLTTVVKPKSKPPKKARYWTLKDLNQFIQLQTALIYKSKEKPNKKQYVTKIRDLAIICLLAGSGARISELCGLLISSYHTDTKIIDLHYNLISTTKTGRASEFIRTTTMKTSASYREVPLPEIIYKNLEWWLAIRPLYMQIHHKDSQLDDGSMFPSPVADRPLTSYAVRQDVAHVIKQLNMPAINVHGFRHTYASFLHESHVEAKRAQVLLGHKDIQTTLNIYTHVSNNEKQAAVDKLNDLFNNNLESSKKELPPEPPLIQ